MGGAHYIDVHDKIDSLTSVKWRSKFRMADSTVTLEFKKDLLSKVETLFNNSGLSDEARQRFRDLLNESDSTDQIDSRCQTLHDYIDGKVNGACRAVRAFLDSLSRSGFNDRTDEAYQMVLEEAKKCGRPLTGKYKYLYEDRPYLALLFDICETTRRNGEAEVLQIAAKEGLSNIICEVLDNVAPATLMPDCDDAMVSAAIEGHNGILKQLLQFTVSNCYISALRNPHEALFNRILAAA